MIAYNVRLRRERLGIEDVAEEIIEDYKKEYWGGPKEGVVLWAFKTTEQIYNVGTYIYQGDMKPQYPGFVQMVEAGYGYDPVLLYD